MAKNAKKPVMLVVASKVRALVKNEYGVRIGADAMLELSTAVDTLVGRAQANAAAERRQTIKDRDVSAALTEGRE